MTSAHAVGAGLPISAAELENKLAMIEKGQQLAGHFPSESDMASARRILTGESTYEEEMADCDERFGPIID